MHNTNNKHKIKLAILYVISIILYVNKMVNNGFLNTKQYSIIFNDNE